MQPPLFVNLIIGAVLLTACVRTGGIFVRHYIKWYQLMWKTVSINGIMEQFKEAFKEFNLAQFATAWFGASGELLSHVLIGAKALMPEGGAKIV